MKINNIEENKTLILAETFMTYGGGSTRINISGDNEDIYLILTFKSDDKKEQTIETNPKNENELEIVFINFNNNFGSYSRQPVLMGTLDNKNIYLVYYIVALQKSGLHKVTISLYQDNDIINNADEGAE